jgi:hypothetical protein
LDYFLKIEGRIVQRCGRFIAVLSQFYDSYNASELREQKTGKDVPDLVASWYGIGMDEPGVFTEGYRIPLFLLP